MHLGGARDLWHALYYDFWPDWNDGAYYAIHLDEK